jgi:D-alanyl-lipoteichoic acid acyltransferase DltB (MBOAT superfamily)
MLFNSLAFAAFLSLALGLFHALPRRHRTAVLLAASLVFYGWWDARFLSLVLSVAGVDFLAARGLARSSRPAVRRAWLALSVGWNLGTLAVFKYLGFFLESAEQALAALGLELRAPLLDVVLPVGVSFFTLQSLGHVIDVWRGDARPARSLLHHATFVAFFPQLLAGPIERSHRLLRQLEEPARVAPATAWSGLLLLLWGLFKKVGVADNLAVYVDPVYAHPHLHGGGSLALATYAFSAQIYCDFSGYSDMAVGMARLFGFELVRNFRTPYFAASVREFWHRWHVSLSTWFRDYLYLPLGGSRGGDAAWVRNVLIVFLVSGLWHGADWTFVAWGGAHGLLYLAGALRARWTGAEAPSARPRRRALAGLLTFHLVTLAWVPFRADSLEHAALVLRGLFGSWGTPVWSPVLANGLACLLVVLAVELAARGREPEQWLVRRRVGAQLVLAATLAVLLLVFGSDTGRHFIYFQF